MMASPIACLLWSVPAFLILTRLPREPRTALPRREQFIQGMTPVAVSIVTLSLASLLAWILVTRAAAPLETGWLTTGILAAVAASGIVLFPYAFSSSGLIRPFRLEAGARFAIGLAWASCWPAAWVWAGEGNPTLFLLGAIGGVLPDALDHWVARHLHQTHIHVVPDPLSPDTVMIAEALVMAIARCREKGQPLRLRLYPGQSRNGRWHRYTLRFDNAERLLVVEHEGTVTSVSLPGVVTTTHPFTLETGDEPLSLELRRMPDGRIALSVNACENTWSHSLVLAAGVGVLAGLAWGYAAGLIAGGAFALHGVADQIGFTGSALLYPFNRNRLAGFQLIVPGQETAFAISAIWLALVVAVWNGARAMLPGDTVPSLISVLLIGGAVPLVAAKRLLKSSSRCPELVP